MIKRLIRKFAEDDFETKYQEMERKHLETIRDMYLPVENPKAGDNGELGFWPPGQQQGAIYDPVDNRICSVINKNDPSEGVLNHDIIAKTFIAHGLKSPATSSAVTMFIDRNSWELWSVSGYELDEIAMIMKKLEAKLYSLEYQDFMIRYRDSSTGKLYRLKPKAA